MVFFCTDLSAFDSILPHASFAEQGNAKRPGAYFPFLEKVYEFAWRKRVTVDSVLNRLKNKKWLRPLVKSMCFWWPKVKSWDIKPWNEVVCVVHTRTFMTSHCNEPLEKMVHSPNLCTTPTSPKQPTVVRSPTQVKPLQWGNSSPNAWEMCEGNIWFLVYCKMANKYYYCSNKFVSFICTRSSLDIQNKERLRDNLVFHYTVDTKGITLKTQARSSLH